MPANQIRDNARMFHINRNQFWLINEFVGKDLVELPPEENLKAKTRNFNSYRRLEDAHSCSGMCKAGLFYFYKDIKHGPPIRTCMSMMKRELDKMSKPYARCAMISGIWCLLLFIFHFGLYFRPTGEKHPFEQNNRFTAGETANRGTSNPYSDNREEPRAVEQDSGAVELEEIPNASIDSTQQP
jgi:hypothetical protein